MVSNFNYRKSCDLCGSEVKHILFSKNYSDPLVWSFLNDYYEGRIRLDDLAGGKYEIARCDRCGFIWQTEILNEKYQGQLYDKWISASHSLNKKKQADFSLYQKYSDEIKKIHDFFPEKPFRLKLLDFGMGWGFWCAMAQAFGYEVEGYEVSEARIAYARQKGIRVIDNAQSLFSRKYDFINAEQVFEHLSQPLATLKKLVSMLTSKGIIHLSVPDGAKIEIELLKPDWQAGKDAIHPLEHINCFTKDTLINFAALAGLKKIDMDSEKNGSLVGFIRKFILGNNQSRTKTNLYFIKS